MQAEENCVAYTPGSPFWAPLEDFAKQLGLAVEAMLRAPIAIAPATSAAGPRYYDVYDPPFSAGRVCALAESTIVVPGGYLGMLAPGKRFKPSLPLARMLAPKCGAVLDCIVVSASGERFFLYGRDVFEDHIVAWVPGLRIVVNESGEALGWGEGRIVKRGERRVRLVAPVWDLGWYLRRGG